MIIISVVLFFILMILMPVLMGALVSGETETGSVTRNWVFGFCLMLALSQPICVPAQFMKADFKYVFIILCAVYMVLSLAGAVYISRKRRTSVLIKEKSSVSFSKYEIALTVIFVLVLLFQLFMLVFMYKDGACYDDHQYITRSTNILASGSLSTDVAYGPSDSISAKYAIMSWDVFIAFIARFSAMNAATAARTMLPVVVVLLFYCITSEISKLLFEDREDRLMFLALVAVLTIFGVSTFGSSLLVCPWNGRTVLFSVILPALFFFVPEIGGNRFSIRKCIIVFAISMAGCSLSASGIMLTGIVGGTISLACLIANNKDSRNIISYICSILPALIMGVVYIGVR